MTPDVALDAGTAPSGPRRYLPAAIAALILAAVRWRQMGPLPTGLDGGEWLALGRGLLGGHGRATDGAYAPLVPAATHLLSLVTPAPSAVQWVGFSTFLLLLLAVGYVTARATGPWLAAAVVVAAGSASTVTEPLAFGGYPQQLAFASILIALLGFASTLAGSGRRASAMSAAGFAVAALAHHIYFPLGLLAAGFTLVAWIAANPGREWRRAGRALMTLGPGILLALPTLLSFRAAGYAPPLEASPFPLADAWRYSTREGVPLWSAVVLAAPVALWAARQRPSPAWLLAAGLLAASGAGFLLTAEPRLAPVLLVSALLAVALGLERLLAVLQRVGMAVALGAAALLAIIAWRGHGEATAFFRFYRVLDPSTIEAARVIEDSDPAGAVAVRADRRGWPAGWWYEGLATQPILVGSDPQWLGFPGERAAAATVAGLFDGGLVPAELRRRAGEAGVSLLVCRKWEWIGWERWLEHPEPAVEIVFDDDETLVLRVVPERPRENAGV